MPTFNIINFRFHISKSKILEFWYATIKYFEIAVFNSGYFRKYSSMVMDYYHGKDELLLWKRGMS